MAGKIAIVVLVMSALFYSGVHSEGVKITSINHSDFTEKQGEAAKIICAINVAQKNLRIQFPIWHTIWCD